MIRINNTQYFHFLQQADDLRRSGALCDAVISVKSETFRAHRLVLACASRTLAQKLMQRDTPVCCTLELFSPRTFQQVLDFTYNQTLEVSVEDLHLLLRAAQFLEMQLLEDQCRKQLDNLESSARIAEDNGEVKELKGDKMHQKKMGQDQKEKLRERSSSVGKESESMEQVLLPVLAEGCNILPPSRKRLRLSSASAMPDNRASVISRPGFSPAWAFPANRWSPMYTLRQMAQNYSDIIAAHPLQTSLQSSVAYPFSLSSPHMFPLLASSFPPPVHSSLMSHHQHYAQNLYAGSGGIGGIIKQGLLKRSKAGHRALSEADQTSETRHPEVHKDSTEKFEDCARCNTSALGDPLLQESTSTPAVFPPSPVSSDGTCTEFSFCGRDAAVQRSAQSSQRDNRGQKPYQCQRCPKTFSLKHQLDTHHRVHTGEKPFECRLCGQRSRDYSAMIKHLRTHGGATPYQCTACREFCSSLVAMQKHVKSHAVHDFPPDWSITSTYLYTSHI